MKILNPLLILILLSLCSCKKEALTDDLSGIVFNNQGVLRVECSDCVVNYSVQNKDYNVNIRDESQDIPFLYSSDFKLKTQVKSLEDQGIRVMVLDSSGRIVGNEVNSFAEGEVWEKSFMINMK